MLTHRNIGQKILSTKNIHSIDNQKKINNPQDERISRIDLTIVNLSDGQSEIDINSRTVMLTYYGSKTENTNDI